MKVEKLCELYSERVPLSLCTAEEIEKTIAFLLSEDLTGEQIFFAINYLAKHKPDELVETPEAVAWHWEEIERYYEIAIAKRDHEHVMRSESEYDERNTFEGKNTPSWFRKSFDSNLFK
jgi:hypothetical protein